jgi:galactonate dehydratase
MKITSLEVRSAAVGAKNCIFVVVKTDEGITGYAETIMKRKTRMMEAGIHELSRFLVGRDPTQIEDLWEKMYRDSFWVGGPAHATPLSAVEIALWDILGKSLGVPIYKLLGGPTRDRIPVYCHCATGPTPETFAAAAKACVAAGHRAMKTGIPLMYGGDAGVRVNGKASRHDYGYYGTRGAIEPSLKETELLPADFFTRVREFFVAAREAVGPQVHLMVDAHGRLSPANARRLCEALSDVEMLFIEEPVPPESAESLREVVASSPVPIATGERWATIYDARRFLEAGAVAVAQPDVVNCGGLMQAKKIAALAEAHYVPIAPHNPNGPLATAASIQLAASIPNFLILETIGSTDDRAEQAAVAQPAIEFEDGCLKLPTCPGLGIEPVFSEIDKRPYQPFEGWR